MAEHRDSDTAMTHSAWEGTAGEAWDVVVRPVSPWWKLDLKEIWRYRDLLSMLVYRDLTAIYKQTILGPVWVLVQPLLTSIMFAVIFGLLARMALDGIPAAALLHGGRGAMVLFCRGDHKNRRHPYGERPVDDQGVFPRLIPPLSTLGSSAFTFLIQLVLFSRCSLVLPAQRVLCLGPRRGTALAARTGPADHGVALGAGLHRGGRSPPSTVTLPL
jgi:hypothetical protein